MTPNQIIHLIDVMAEATARSPHTLARYAAGSGDFYARLKVGHDITTRRAARVVQWFSDQWPSDLEWPLDVPRPVPKAKESAA